MEGIIEMTRYESEADARIVIDDLLREAGWDPTDKSMVRTEVMVVGHPAGEGAPGRYPEHWDEPETVDQHFTMPSSDRADSVLYNQRGRPLAVIEAKKNAINPYVAKQQALPYAQSLDAPFIFLTNGELTYFWDWKNDDARPVTGFFSRRDLERMVEREASKEPLATVEIPELYFRQGETRTLRPYQAEAMRAMDHAFELGKRRFLIELPTGTGKTDLICFYLKLLDEEQARRELQTRMGAGNGASLFPGQADRYRWSKWRFKRGNSLRDYVRDEVFPFMASLVKDEPQVAEYFRDAVLEIVDPNVLKQVIDELDSIELNKLGPDVKGEIFEYLLTHLGQSALNGQFRTPRQIRAFMVEMVDPDLGDTIYDPACGTVDFLIDAIDHILARYSEEPQEVPIYGEDWLERRGQTLEEARKEIPNLQTYRKGPGEKIPDWGRLEASIHGTDVSRQMMRISMMNLVLHGIRHARLKRANVLSEMGGLTEDDLNPALEDDIATMFRDGHLNEAVRKALERFEKAIQEALGDHNTFGRELMAKAFGGDPPPIPLNAGQTANDRSEQEGFKFLTMGAMSGMRNLYSHGDVAQMSAMDASKVSPSLVCSSSG